MRLGLIPNDVLYLSPAVLQASRSDAAGEGDSPVISRIKLQLSKLVIWGIIMSSLHCEASFHICLPCPQYLIHSGHGSITSFASEFAKKHKPLIHRLGTILGVGFVDSSIDTSREAYLEQIVSERDPCVSRFARFQVVNADLSTDPLQSLAKSVSPIITH